MLDVPVQENALFGGSRNVSSSSLESAVFTLDPRDKYLPPGVRRASTTSAVHARKAHIPATTRLVVRAPRNASIEAGTVPPTSNPTQDVLTLERQHSLLSVFHRMRQTRSAGSNTRSNLAWPRKIFTRAGQSAKHDAPGSVSGVAKLPDCTPSLPPTRTGDGLELPIQLPSTAGSTDRVPTALIVNLRGSESSILPLEQSRSSAHSQSALPNKREQGHEDEHVTSSIRNSKTSFLSNYYTPPEELRDTLSYFAPTLADERNDMALNEHIGRLNLAPNAGATLANSTEIPLDEHISIPDAAPSAELLGSLGLDFDPPKDGYAESFASYATSVNFSPCLASNTTHSGPMSPCHLSQPETPVMSECDDEFLPPLRDPESLAQMGRSTSSDLDLLSAKPSSRAAPPHLPRPQGSDARNPPAALGGFQGYSLVDHASVLTIRKLPSIPLKKTDGAAPFPRQSSKQDLVHSWNDGSEHRMSALGELVDDLGYLGDVII